GGQGGQMATLELGRLTKVKGFREALDLGESARARVLEDLYWIDNDRTRPALLEYLGIAPFQANSFRFIRRIFKAAELRRDAEVFGQLAYRFEKTAPNKVPYFYVGPRSRNWGAASSGRRTRGGRAATCGRGAGGP